MLAYSSRAYLRPIAQKLVVTGSPDVWYDSTANTSGAATDVVSWCETQAGASISGGGDNDKTPVSGGIAFYARAYPATDPVTSVGTMFLSMTDSAVDPFTSPTTLGINTSSGGTYWMEAQNLNYQTIVVQGNETPPLDYKIQNPFSGLADNNSPPLYKINISYQLAT